MKYLIVLLVFFNVFALANLFKKAVLLILNLPKSRKNKIIIKNKKYVEKPAAQYFNNRVYKNSIISRAGIERKKSKYSYLKNKNVKIALIYLQKKNKTKIKKLTAKNIRFNKKILFENRNLEFNLYSNNADYFLKNLKFLLSINKKTAIIKNRKFNVLTLNEKTYLVKISAFSNRSLSVFVSPISHNYKKQTQKIKKQSPTSQKNHYKITVNANINTFEPTLYVEKIRRENKIYYNNNMLSILCKTKNNAINKRNAKTTRQQKNNFKGAKSSLKVNTPQTNLVVCYDLFGNKCAKVVISSTEFCLIKTSVISNLKPKCFSNKYLFFNKKRTQTIFSENKNQKNRASKSKIAPSKTNEKVLGYFIKTKNKDINYLLNSFLPYKVAEKYRNQNSYNNVVSFIKCANYGSLQNYSYKTVIRWLIAKKEYVLLYHFLLHNVLGVVFDSNCVHFTKSNQSYGKISVNYNSVAFTKYNNINGFYYVYNNIIFKNVPTLQIKSVELKSEVV